MTRAGIMLMSGDRPLGSVCATNEVSALIEELRFTFGEGPGIDAWRRDRPVLEPDLAALATPQRPAFTGLAVRAGVRATLAFPMQVGSARVGILNLCADRPGFLTNDQHADALAVAEVVADVILSVQATALPGALAARLQRARTSTTSCTKRRGWCRRGSTSWSARHCSASVPTRTPMSVSSRRSPPIS